MAVYVEAKQMTKKTYILGISCFYHDSAAALICDGEIIAAAEEDRFTRVKHDFSFPVHAAQWCLRYAGIGADDLAFVVFYDKPFIKFERILETCLMYAPRGIRRFIQAMPLWLKQKLWIPDTITEQLGYSGKVLFCGHHESHAGSAFYPSPFEESAFLTIDGVGEWETASFGVGRGNALTMSQHIRFPHSIGLLYSAFTYYIGFKVNSGEYKLMGLAPYGEPVYAKIIRDKLIDIKEDGSFKLNMAYFDYGCGMRMTNKRFHDLFGGPPRVPESKITQKEMDVAASIQQVTEEVMLKMARHVRRVTGQENLCLAGGVALNCVANGRIMREGIFRRMWIQPASSDAGGALGAALCVWYRYLDKERLVTSGSDAQKGSFLGTVYTDEDVESALKETGVSYTRVARDQIPATVAGLIDDQQVIGWFQGRMEFGPRALGARSIIGDARSPEMQSRMNLKIKYRESFRPFAPAVLREEVGHWFDADMESPYMLLVAGVNESCRVPGAQGEQMPNARGLDKLKMVRSSIPAVTHVDYSARVQTVDGRYSPLYYDTIDSFFRRTGCPVVINTSFNVRGEPLVNSPHDAIQCFLRTEMDYLIIGSCMVNKKDQKPELLKESFQRDLVLD